MSSPFKTMPLAGKGLVSGRKDVKLNANGRETSSKPTPKKTETSNWFFRLFGSITTQPKEAGPFKKAKKFFEEWKLILPTIRKKSIFERFTQKIMNFLKTQGLA
ncbi:hypothetical protein ACH42_15460 [Endozoicomonas sp. (ex Bugula neritina AB1)]|nr:hypothetical protein ACH42_15460 [Endozoicomonas sp. (ex Bugula neritina AB1)]